jgi:hypothetical protein
LHLDRGNLLGGFHHEHRAFTILRVDGGEAEAAIAGNDGSDAVLAGVRAGRVPEDLRVIMGVGVDMTGGDDQPVGVDDALPGSAAVPDPRDFPVLDSDVGPEAGKRVPSMIVPFLMTRSNPYMTILPVCRYAG